MKTYLTAFLVASSALAPSYLSATHLNSGTLTEVERLSFELTSKGFLDHKTAGDILKSRINLTPTEINEELKALRVMIRDVLSKYLEKQPIPANLNNSKAAVILKGLLVEKFKGAMNPTISFTLGSLPLEFDNNFQKSIEGLEIIDLRNAADTLITNLWIDAGAMSGKALKIPTKSIPQRLLLLGWLDKLKERYRYDLNHLKIPSKK